MSPALRDQPRWLPNKRKYSTVRGRNDAILNAATRAEESALLATGLRAAGFIACFSCMSHLLKNKL